jgi:hypothetical protein
LASVALHDWQSYATMRALAEEKYSLSIIEDNLPGHSVEQVSSKNVTKYLHIDYLVFLQGRDTESVLRS